MIMLTTSLPTPIANWLLKVLGRKPTLFISNVQTTPIPYVIGGAESIKMASMIPGSGDVGGGFLLISHLDVF